MGSPNITVTSSLALCLMQGVHDSVVVSNDGPGTAFLDDQSNVSSNSSDYALLPGDAITWAANTPLWAIATPGMTASISISHNVTIFGGIRLYSKTINPAVCTGGTIVTSTGFETHEFYAGGTLTVTDSGLSDILVVGGGGGAGSCFVAGGAGGGSGGVVLEYVSFYLTAGIYAVVVGAGGIGANGGVAVNGGDGGTSSLGVRFVALGGVGSLNTAASNANGQRGISGSGAGASASYGGSATGGVAMGIGVAGDNYSGFAGGNAVAVLSVSHASGGGGGAGGAGGNGAGNVGGNGGAGYTAFDGVSYGGGGGGSGGTTGGTGNGGGGNGGGGAAGSNGAANRGGGGGGSGTHTAKSGDGGSGVVKVRVAV